MKGKETNKPKRSSSRTVVLSKAFKVVDEDTRREFQNRRIQSLEADNFNEIESEVVEEEGFDDSDNDGSVAKKKKPRKGQSTVAVSKWYTRRVKPLERLVLEECEGSTDANYLTIAAGPSMFPTASYCSVCGYIGNYTCVRCGLRYCSIKCNNHHKETRCMKFSY